MKTPQQIYNSQNKILHMAFNRIGLPYKANRELWLRRAGEIARRQIRSLGDLTLGERTRLIVDLKHDVTTLPVPTVPQSLRNWVKGDPDVLLSRDALLAKIDALKADLGLTSAYVNGIARKMFKVDAYRFLDGNQLHKVVAALGYHQKRKKGAVYRP